MSNIRYMTKPRFSLIPQYSFCNVTDIGTEFLEQLGIKFLMLDLDNTLAAYDEREFSNDIIKWITDIKSTGIELFIISNSSRTKRVTSFTGSIGVEYIMKSRKPSPAGLLRAMETAGFKSGESALAGDQIFTDVLAANRAGVLSVVVRPRRFTNPFLALRYFIELPFRKLVKN